MSSVSTDLLTGGAWFLDDVRDPLLVDAAHVIFVRSTVAHARISVDATAARALPGVLAVVDGASCEAVPAGAYSPLLSDRFTQPLLAWQRVRFVGEPIAAVVGETRTAAIEASELVDVTYDELEPMLTVEQAAADGVLLFDDASLCPRIARVDGSVAELGLATNVVRRGSDDDMSFVHEPGPFEAADVVVRRRFVNPRQVAAPIEARGAAAAWVGDDLHVWLSTQTPHSYRNRIAPIYGLGRAQIHVIAGPHVGGGFGGKGAPGPEEQLVPLLARTVQRPVRWVESRTENLTAAPQGRAEAVDIVLAGDRDGTLRALRLEILKDAGAYPSSGAGLPNKWGAPTAAGVYDIAHVEFDSITAVTNKPPVSALRAAGRAPAMAALERAIDLFAAEVGLDAAEVRRRNLIAPDQLPHDTVTGGHYDEADYPAALEAALDGVDYAAVRADQQARRQRGDVVQLGIGIGNYVMRTNGGSSEQAIVRINSDGSATVVTGTTDQGQDHEATWRIIASGELGIAAENITVVEGITDEIATGIGAIGSRSVQTAGMAVQVASADVVSTARSLAADLLEAAEADVVLDRELGQFHVAGTPSRAFGWAELAVQGLEQERELACDFTYDPGGNDVYPSGCHVAVVEVDTDTGATTLVRFVAADDAGVRVNPASVEAQLHGGIALGIAQVLGEASTFDAYGNPEATNFLDYQIITMDQLVQFDLVAQETASSVTPFGWKAVGESGPMGATPAVHNAVLDAIRHLGVDHIDIPCTPHKVWQAIAAAG